MGKKLSKQLQEFLDSSIVPVREVNLFLPGKKWIISRDEMRDVEDVIELLEDCGL